MDKFSSVDSGVIKGFSTRMFRADNVPFRCTVTETITFQECDARPLDDLPSMRVDVSRAYVVFGETEKIVRYATTNRVRIAAGTLQRPIFHFRDYNLIAFFQAYPILAVNRA